MRRSFRTMRSRRYVSRVSCDHNMICDGWVLMQIGGMQIWGKGQGVSTTGTSTPTQRLDRRFCLLERLFSG